MGNWLKVKKPEAPDLIMWQNLGAAFNKRFF